VKADSSRLQGQGKSGGGGGGREIVDRVEEISMATAKPEIVYRVIQ
jgi:hypothetical protein